MAAPARQRSTEPPKLRVVSKPLPQHDFVESHHILLASKKYGSRERIQAAKKKTWRASGEVACARIREFAYDLGAEIEWAYSWKAAAARRLGLSYTTMWNIISQHVTTVSTRTVDHVAKISGVPVREFYDNETR